jgi:hypothetical protein
MAAGGQLSDRAAGAACPTRVAAVEEIDAWLKKARKGDRFVYCTGPDLVRGPAAERAKALYMAGLVDLIQPRAAGCIGRDFIVERRGTPLPAKDSAAAPDDDAMGVILDALTRAAQRGAPCPSDTELARAAGLATRNQAQWRVAKLRADGLIRSWTTGDQEIGRVVFVVAIDKWTRAPAGWSC